MESFDRHEFVRAQDLLAVESIGDQRSAVACAVVRAPIKSGTLAAILNGSPHHGPEDRRAFCESSL